VKQMPEENIFEIKTKKDCSCKFSDTFYVKNESGIYEVFVNKHKLFSTDVLDYVEEFFQKRAHLFEEDELNRFINNLRSWR
jgi:hypothetical protein